jgi:DNA modification methylase
MLFSLKAAMDEQNIRLAQLLIWVKSQPVLGRKDYMGSNELILYGWHGTHNFYKSKDSTVLFCPKPNISKFHPTTKPISLIRRLILNSSKINEFVF